MKILFVSDLHGRTVWREARFETVDRIVFLGDYTDSYDVDDGTIFTNLNEIIRLKREEPDRFVLLIGNHDAQYLHFPHYRCSGFRSRAQPALSKLFAEYRALFQVAHQQGAYLFTHAGVTNQWLARLLARTGHSEQPITPDFDLAGLFNDVHRQSLRVQSLLFEVGPKRGGYNAHSGPVWADRTETHNDYLFRFHQVVGHTPTDDFLTIRGESDSITYTDVLQTKTAFYEITIPD